MKTKLKSLPYYPLLFAISPVLSLYARNTSQVTLQDAGMSLGLVLGITAVVYGLSLALSRDGRRAALVALLFVVLFLLYGSVSDGLLALVPNWVFPDDDRRYLLPILGLIFVVYSAYAFKTPRSLAGATRFLNASSGALALVLVINTGYGYAAQGWLISGRVQNERIAAPTVTTHEPSQYPDIYYIILDGYARQDILAYYYGYDNSTFIEQLESMGFYVARDSRANYCQTALSLASSLNMEHISTLLPTVNSDSRNRVPLLRLIRDSAVVRTLRARGYRVVAFETGYEVTELKGADLYLGPTTTPTSNALFGRVLRMSPIPAVLGREAVTAYDAHRNRILHTYSKLADLPDQAAPMFVFAHVVSPHPPFVFDAHGVPVSWQLPYSLRDASHLIRPDGLSVEQYQAAYLAQLAYVNTRVLGVLNSILARPSREAVVILQSDHGPGSLLDWEDASAGEISERFGILNAYRLPGNGSAALYPAITPVNTFRIVLDTYLGTEYPLTADTSYFSAWSRPFELLDVTDGLD